MADGYMFFDAETANNTQEICSLAYILCDNNRNQISEPTNQLINIKGEFGNVQHRTHHISKEDVAGMPTFLEFCQKTDFIKHLSNFILVAHNAKSADLTYLKKGFASSKIELPPINFLDTYLMAADLKLPCKLSLDSICAYYKIPFKKHHDALACRAIFEKLRPNFEKLN